MIHMLKYYINVNVNRYLMNLSQVSKLTKISRRMLRHYESLNLVTPKRSDNNYRSYSSRDIEIINKISILNKSGIPLKVINQLLPCFNLNDQSFTLCSLVKNELESQLVRIDSEIENLKITQEIISTLLIK